MRWPLGASSLGAPMVSLDRLIGWLTDTGASALELRVGPDEPAGTGSTAAVRDRVRGQLVDAGIEVLSVASHVRIGEAGNDDAVISDLLAHLRLAMAARLASGDRVAAGRPPAPGCQPAGPHGTGVVGRDGQLHPAPCLTSAFPPTLPSDPDQRT